MTLTYCLHDSPLGPLLLVANDHGLVRVQLQEHRPWPIAPDWHCQPSRFDAARCQLDAYFAGTLARFTLPLAAEGTPFQQAVWQALQTIPLGETRSYTDIAHAIGKPRAVRAVGAANGANPLAIIVPCHRVIGRSGALTGYAGGVPQKAWLLGHEAGCAGLARSG